jgi:SAM-dependent methyltransferase
VSSYLTVTEVAGDRVTREQVERLCNRYRWVASYCAGKEVIEAACGSGQGLGWLASVSARLVAGDYSQGLLSIARQHYRERIPLLRFDAACLPFASSSWDVILLLEAIYYLVDPDRFASECARILRPGGTVLIATANKDLYDFNPSPHSHQYLGVVELVDLFRRHGFSSHIFGHLPVSSVSWRQRLLRPAKMVAARLNLIPGTARGKQLLKRLVFGELVEMPAEIDDGMESGQAPVPLAPDQPDREHKVIYCAARLETDCTKK